MSKKAEEYVVERRSKAKPKTDPLDESLEEADRQLARDAKRKRLEAIVLERETKIKKLKSNLEKGENQEQSGPAAPMTTSSLITNLITSGVDPKVANEWLKTLDPQAMGALIALQSNNPALSMLAFGMTSQKKGEGLTVKDVVELNKAMQSSGGSNIKDIAELAKALVSANKPSETVSPKEMVDSTLTAVQTGIALASGGEKPEKSWFDKLMSTPEGIQSAKEVGLFGGNPEYLKLQKEIRSADRQFMKDMKESDRRWEVRLQEMRNESRRMWAEVQESKRRTDLLSKGLKKIGSAIARAVAEEEEEEVEEAKAKPKRKASKVKQYQCECGAAISVPKTAKAGETVQCAKCGNVYSIEATK